MPKTKLPEWEVIGTDELVGATVTYMDYDGSIQATKDGREYRTVVETDWGYCYCYDYGDSDSRCSCTPTMTVRAERKRE